MGVYMWFTFYIRLDDNRNHYAQSSLSSSLRFNERIMKKKKKSNSNKRVNAYVQGRHRKNLYGTHVRGKRRERKKRMYTSTIGVEDEKGGGPIR